MRQDDSLDQALSRLYHAPDAPEAFETGWRAAVRREEIAQVKPSGFSWKKMARIAAPVCAAAVLVCGSLWAGTLEMTSAGTAQNAAVMRSAKYEVTEEAAYDLAAADSGYGLVSSSASTSLSSGAAAKTVAAQSERKIVRSASLTVRAADFDTALADVQTMLADMGGYVEYFYQYGETTRRASLNMRVPSGMLDAFLTGAEGLGRVTDRSESTTDLTTQYADNQARLDTLYAKRDRLNALLIQAENVSDLIEIESAIADTQYQIDSYETSQRSIDNQVDMSDVSLTLVEETAADTATADVSLGERIRAGLNASLRWLGKFLRDMAVFVAMALPVIVPVALIVLAVWLIRRIRKNKEV